MKSLMSLWVELVKELASWCSASSTDRDIERCRDRVKHEGLSFLTITLPSFGSDFQKSLDQGMVTDDLFPGFARKGGLPRFLGGFLQLVFDPASGRLLNDPCIDAVFAVRQLTLVFGKIELDTTEDRKRAAFAAYVQCEKEVRQSDFDRSVDLLDRFSAVCSTLYSRGFTLLDDQIRRGEILPSHGPGATADRLVGNQKFQQSTWTARLERIFPFVDYALPNYRYWELAQRVTYLEPRDEIPVKVITVPKTLKTPRIIAMEPTHMQYMQQGIRRLMYDVLEDASGPARHLVGQIGFTDQVPNQDMARIGSLDGSLATLDLSEASDRVSNQLVRTMFSRFPHLSEAVDATRSRKADVPGYGVMRLAKFASMGSALCFPVEAMVFLAIVYVAISSELNRPLSRKDIESFRGRVRVYGDDIIVPVRFAEAVTRYLHAFGLKVNVRKSYWNGKFRESCGEDFYDGVNVTPVRFRQSWPSHRRDVRSLQALLSFRNHVYQRGLWKTAGWLDDKIRPLLGGHYPVVGPEASVLGRVSFLGYESTRMDPHLHNPQVRGWVVRAPLPQNAVDGVPALLKVLSKQGVDPLSADHLERSGRPRAVSTKLVWSRSY